MQLYNIYNITSIAILYSANVVFLLTMLLTYIYQVKMIGNCNKESRYLNLTFIKNLDCGNAKVIRIGSARNSQRQFVGFAQIGE